MAPPWWSAGPTASWKPPAHCACCWSSTRMPRTWPVRHKPCRPLSPLARPLPYPLRRFPSRSRHLSGPPGRNGRRGGRPGGKPVACAVTCRSSPRVPSPQLPGQRQAPTRAPLPPKPPGNPLAGRSEILCISLSLGGARSHQRWPRRPLPRIALPPRRRQRLKPPGSPPSVPLETPLETHLGASPGRLLPRMPQPRRPPPQPAVNPGEGPRGRVPNRPCRSPRA